MLDLKNHPRNEWRELIKECKYIISLITDKFVDLDVLIVPQDFIDGRKKIREVTRIEKRKKMEGEIVGYECQQLDRSVYGKNSKLVREVYDLATLHQNKHMSVYGTKEQSELMDDLYSVFHPNKVKFIAFSEREIKHLEDVKLHNWIKIEEFMKGDNISFKRIITSYLIDRLIMEQKAVFLKSETLKQISTKLYEDVKSLHTYRNEWWRGGDEEIYKAMLKIAEENNLFDESIYYLYSQIKCTLTKLKFLNPILSNMSQYDSRNEYIYDALSDLFKYYKQKVNLENYKLVMNDEECSEIVTDELIEEITNN